MEQEITLNDLSYRNKIATNEFMGIKEPTSEYKNKVNMKRLELNKKLLSFQLKEDFKLIKWEEDDIIINWTNSLYTNISKYIDYFNDNYEMENLINYLCPQTKNIFFYNYQNNIIKLKNSGIKNLKISDKEFHEYAVQRDFTFNNFNINPYNTLPVFSFNITFQKNDKFFTFGINDLFKNIHQIQDYFIYYLDKMFYKNFKNFINEIKNNEKLSNICNNPLIYIINYETNKTIKKLEYKFDVVKKFGDIVINSNNINYYNCNYLTVEEKLQYKDEDEKLKNLFKYEEINDLYFIQGLSFDQNNIDELIVDLVKTLSKGLLKNYLKNDEDKELFSVFIFIFLIQNKLVDLLNDLNTNIMDMEDNNDEQIINLESEYNIIIKNLNNTIFYLKKIYTNALIIKNYILQGFNIEKPIYHDLLDFTKPIKGYLIRYAPINKIEKTSFEDYNNVYDNLKDKSINFEIEIFNTKIIISLIKVNNYKPIDYNFDITFEKVFIIFGVNCIIPINYEENNKISYKCTYIHSKKNTEDNTFSTLRLEFKPEMNIPFKLITTLEGKPVKTNFSSRALNILNEIISTVYYIKVDLLDYYDIDYIPLIKENNDFIAKLNDEVSLNYKITKNMSGRITNIKIGEKNYEIKNINDIKQVPYNDIISTYPSDFKNELYKDEEINKIFSDYNNDFNELSFNQLEDDNEFDEFFNFNNMGDFNFNSNEQSNKKKIRIIKTNKK